MTRTPHRLVAWVLCAAALGGCAKSLPLVADFEKSPDRLGWTYRPIRGDETEEPWTDTHAYQGHAAIALHPGHCWESPPFAVSPGATCRLRLDAVRVEGTRWQVAYFDEQGLTARAEQRGVFEAREDGRQEVCFAMPDGPAAGRLRFFRPAGGDPEHVTEIDAVFLQSVDRGTIQTWIEAVSERFAPVKVKLPRPEGLDGYIGKLRPGAVVRVVVVGDAAARRLAGAPWGVLAGRAFAGSQVHVTAASHVQEGCAFFRKPGRVARYILARAPDLVIFTQAAGEAEDVRAVIQQVRGGSGAAVLVATPVVPIEEAAATTQPATQPAASNGNGMSAALVRLASEEGLGVMDLHAAWASYLRTSGQPAEVFYMDGPILTEAGKGVLARLVLASLKGS